MKKKLFLAALAVTALAGCSDNEFVGNNSPDVNPNETYAISFGSLSKGTTRADHVGADAAGMLNNKFIVGGFKSNGPVTATNTTTGTVFDSYIVNWTANTAGKTESNTSDWEYVGVTAAAPSTINGTQSIKYWDYSFDQYDFIAYSTKDAVIETEGSASAAIAANKVVVTPIDPQKARTQAYQFAGSKDNLAKCYIADMVTVYKDGTDGMKYGDEVTLTFRNLTSKARVALYETIPGYSVKDVKFYTENKSDNTDISTGASVDNVTLFTTGSSKDDYFFTGGIYNVRFPTIGKDNVTPTKDSDYNKAHVSFTSVGTQETTLDFGTVQYKSTDYEGNLTSGNFLGRTLPTASFAGTADPWYTTVLPNENGTVLELRIDYTLLATDGSGEEIKIHGAKAFVPQIYAQWKPNYAYTYIFKISDNTNGWTNTDTTEPAGLYPITFDAVVVDSEEHTQSTITTVATPSITTYQKGHDLSKNEYAATDGDIYVQVMKDGQLQKVNEDNNGHICSLWEITNSGTTPITEALVMDALNIRESYDASSTIGRNGVTLTKVTAFAKDITTIPGPDGNDITIGAGDAAKFTPEAKTYAVTYKDKFDNAETYIYSAETVSEAKTVDSNTWYSDPDGKNPVTSLEAGKIYYKKYTNRNIEWAVKVIKVE